jgi:hypothetical protein
MFQRRNAYPVAPAARTGNFLSESEFTEWVNFQNNGNGGISKFNRHSGFHSVNSKIT